MGLWISYNIVSASGVTIWGFGVPGGESHQAVCVESTHTYLVYAVALNTARDMGSRLMAITIWGLPGKPTLLSFIYTQQGHHDV